jgi:hypothetical protein
MINYQNIGVNIGIIKKSSTTTGSTAHSLTKTILNRQVPDFNPESALFQFFFAIEYSDFCRILHKIDSIDIQAVHIQSGSFFYVFHQFFTT